MTIPPNPDTRLRSGIWCFAVGSYVNHQFNFSGGKHVQYIHDISKYFYTWFAYMVSDPDDSWSSGLLNYNGSCMLVCEINLLSTITNND